MIDKMRQYHYNNKLSIKTSKEYRDELFKNKLYESPLDKYKIQFEETQRKKDENKLLLDRI